MRQDMRWRPIIVASIVALLLAGGAMARTVQLREGALAETEPGSRDIQETIWFQGFLADSSTGDPIDATYDIVARIYDHPTVGSLLWGPETHNSVTINEGWFNIELGSVVSPLPDFGDPPYYLRLTVNGENLTPRLKLASVPSAFQSSNSDELMLPFEGTTGVLDTGFDLTHDGANQYDALAVYRENGTNGAYALYVRNNADEGVIRGYHNGSNTSDNAPVAALGIGYSTNPSPVVEAESDGQGPAYWGESAGPYTAFFQSYSDSGTPHVVHAEYLGTDEYGVAVFGESIVEGDEWGIGGDFRGGYIGCSGEAVNPSGIANGLFGSAEGGGTNYGVWGQASGGSVANYAGYFNGDVHVDGTLTGGSPLTMRTDYPLDPAEKYLNQAAVVSDDMRTVFDGVVVLDASGTATVVMPEWADVVNGDFRYQLTCVGGYAPVYVADEIEGGTFTIAGGEPGMKVSWQVTGIRHDAYADANPFEAVAEKPSGLRGKYLHPDVYGAPAEQHEAYEAKAMREEHKRAREQGRRPRHVPRKREEGE
ncbi:MAG: hypothetical protein GF400_10425 [Candidatus Eisenbacteria bacterium]|nr:hypothetical protein [Candidatus Eisenbacteria bacterium]